MARIHHSLPPKGTRIGIAFSGGLDTRTAVAWMSRQGLEVYAYTADLAQPDEANVEDIPPIATDHGARVARLVDCRDAMVREGVTAIQCGAFHLTTGGKRYFNTTPLGRAVTTTAIIRAMREDGVHVEPLPRHPGDGGAGVETAREGDADAGALGRERVVDAGHGQAFRYTDRPAAGRRERLLPWRPGRGAGNRSSPWAA